MGGVNHMKKWWHERVVYQIYPRSYQDSNGDGIGDIEGIIAHLDELKDLGIGIIWLSPIYPSPNEDFGYDISDYRDVHPDFGTLEDMDRLIEEANKRDIKIIMDLVINHTSDEHLWFEQSRDKDSSYRDYYFWRPGKNGKRPNNWTGFFGDNCWEYDEKSGEYYLHLFSKKQPDLNYYNPKVLEEVKDIMKFWLDRGIAGFRCDVINLIYKNSLDDGRKMLALTGMEHYLSQEGAHKILKILREEVLGLYDCFTVGETVLITPQIARDFCGEDRKELDMIFSFEHMESDCFYIKWFKRKFKLKRFAKIITKWQTELEWNANYLENHDQPRSVSRFGNDKKYWAESAKLLCVLLLTLRGTPYIYQGQEIGMTNYDFINMSDIMDVEGHTVYNLLKKFHVPNFLIWKAMTRTCRDNARTPMQWNNSINAGFTTGTPWMAINKNYTLINMESQIKDPNSIRNFYKVMIALRTDSDIIKNGIFKPIQINNRLFIYKRELNGESLMILLNFSSHSQKADYQGELIISNYNKTAYNGILHPYEAVILVPVS